VGRPTGIHAGTRGGIGVLGDSMANAYRHAVVKRLP
jgi:hypothetical protein